MHIHIYANQLMHIVEKPVSGPLVCLRITAAVTAFAAALFITAGTVHWIEAWGFTIILSIYLTYSTVWLMKNNPGLLKERLRVRETKKWDKIILSLFAICFVTLFMMPGLDFRYQWTVSPFPLIIEVLAFTGLCISCVILFLVTKENTYASKAVKIQSDAHHVVTTGPYTYVRHPMYAGGMLLLICMPLALGSLFSLIPAASSVILFVARTHLEDTMLYETLPGYKEYTQKTRYRLLPGIW